MLCKINRVLFYTFAIFLCEVISISLAKSDNEFLCKKELPLKETEKTVKLVEEKYRKIKTIKANFTQSAQIVGLTEVIQSTGFSFFKMPGKMNWEYETPDKKKFISNAETVWFYEPEVNQVTIGELKKSFDTEVPAMFMLGIGKLSETFDISSSCLTKSENLPGILLKLSPKNQASSLKTLQLLVSKDLYVPIGARLTDVSDTINEFLFLNLVVDQDILDETFNFSPPSGTDIIYNN